MSNKIFSNAFLGYSQCKQLKRGLIVLIEVGFYKMLYFPKFCCIIQISKAINHCLYFLAFKLFIPPSEKDLFEENPYLTIWSHKLPNPNHNFTKCFIFEFPVFKLGVTIVSTLGLKRFIRPAGKNQSIVGNPYLSIGSHESQSRSLLCQIGLIFRIGQ